jgi:HNH endonuclease
MIAYLDTVMQLPYLNTMTQKDLIYYAIASETDDCIIWPGERTGRDYPRYESNMLGKRMRIAVHRFVCEEVHGKPPFTGAHAAHACGVRLCINPRHLRWTTARDNKDDEIIHGINRGGRWLNMENPRLI